MSVIGIKTILQRVKDDNLIENLGKRELENPEGVGVDLRLGSIHKIIEGGAFIEADSEDGLGRRKGVKTEKIAEFKPDAETQEEISIEPGEYYLVQTFESVNTPSDLMPVLYARSSLFRAGLLLLNNKVDPGYKGSFTMGLTNLSKFPVNLQLGARFCNIVFFKIEGEVVAYRGQHQGGRLSPHEVERQV